MKNDVNCSNLVSFMLNFYLMNLCIADLKGVRIQILEELKVEDSLLRNAEAEHNRTKKSIAVICWRIARQLSPARSACSVREYPDLSCQGQSTFPCTLERGNSNPAVRE